MLIKTFSLWFVKKIVTKKKKFFVFLFETLFLNSFYFFWGGGCGATPPNQEKPRDFFDKVFLAFPGIEMYQVSLFFALQKKE